MIAVFDEYISYYYFQLILDDWMKEWLYNFIRNMYILSKYKYSFIALDLLKNN